MSGYLNKKRDDMLRNVSKIAIIIGVIVSINACFNKERILTKVIIDTCETDSIRNVCVMKSMGIADEKTYWSAYNQLNDSLRNWVKQRIENYKFWGDDSRFIVDTVLCFNPLADKFTAIVLLNDSVSDVLVYYYGVKIAENWYFVGGPSLVLRRQYYQDDINTPIPFTKLEQLAAHYKYRYYLIDDGQGGLDINDDFFSDITSQAYCGNCSTQQQWDLAYIRSTRLKWLPNKR
jgi:hypothetical protein